ncbi:uncharacterized protein LOC115212865 [Argonauta hians]
MLSMAPPAVSNPFCSYKSFIDMSASTMVRAENTCTYGTSQVPQMNSLTEFIRKLSILRLQRLMFSTPLPCDDLSYTTLIRLLTENMITQQNTTTDLQSPLSEVNPLTDPVEYDSLISESNSIETPSDEDIFLSYNENDTLFCTKLTTDNQFPNTMNSSDLDCFSEPLHSECDKQNYLERSESFHIESDDDGHYSLDESSSDDDWDTNGDDMSCNNDIPFWQTIFAPVVSDDECDSDEEDTDDYDRDDDFSLSGSHMFCVDNSEDSHVSEVPIFAPVVSNDDVFEISFSSFHLFCVDNSKDSHVSEVPNFVREANDRWNKIYNNTDISRPSPKVHFAAADQLETKHLMFAWSYAYQAARKGEWLQHHVDAERFQKRINNLASILNPILEPSHRLKIFKRLNI